MNKFFKTLHLLAAIAFLVTACIPPVVDVAQAAPAEVGYQAVLGKSLSDQNVADFIASNNCVQTGAFQLCRTAGVALWMDSDQIVRSAYLYLDNSDGFSAYRGELPMKLEASDTMADVEQKFSYPRDAHMLSGPWEPGLPDEGFSPDHVHYWAIYKRFDLTVIYNTPDLNDKNATIHAILTRR